MDPNYISPRMLQALRLIDYGSLTEAAIVSISREAKALLEMGFIDYAPKRWTAYEATKKGLDVLEANKDVEVREGGSVVVNCRVNPDSLS